MPIQIYFHYKFVEGPWGGGNQFLKALRGEFVRNGVCSNNIKNADAVIFNSHQDISKILSIKRQHRNHMFIHRLDGPMSYRGDSGRRLDRLIFYINHLIADGTVFQSEWSRKASIVAGYTRQSFEKVIYNAPDPQIFFPGDRNSRQSLEGKIRLIATSWSGAMDKGAEIYNYLDNNLDFGRYDMTFVGNSPIEFRNIVSVAPVSSEKLADILRQHDIFVSASQYEACSNSLLEASHCGLEVIARNSSSNPELVNTVDNLFDDRNDILDTIEFVAKSQDKNNDTNRIVHDIQSAGSSYYTFVNEILADTATEKYTVKTISFWDYLKAIVMIRIAACTGLI